MLKTGAEIWHDVRHGLSLLTRIPVKVDTEILDRRGAVSTWSFPLVGLMVGSIVYVAGLSASHIVEAEIAAILGLVTAVMITGALHEDGLSDCADGFWGAGWHVNRLKIMKDSATGVYGTVALILSLGLRFLAYTALLQAGLWILIIPILAGSRVWMTLIMHMMTNAREEGLAHHVGVPPRISAIIAVGLTVAITLPFLQLAWIAVVAGGLGAFYIAKTAKKKLKGYTGDVLGAAQQMAEITALLAVLVLI